MRGSVLSDRSATGRSTGLDRYRMARQDLGVPTMLKVLVFTFTLLAAGAVAAQVPSWHPDGSKRCLASPYDVSETAAQQEVLDVIVGLFDALEPFPSIVAALDSASPDICVEDRTIDARGYLDVDRNIIVLHEKLTTAEKRVILIHELRHLEQLQRGFCPSTDVSMTAAAHATFALEADAEAIATLVGWTLRENGSEEAWNVLLSRPNYADIAARFDEEMARTQDAASAVAAAFDQWYMSDWRVETYYVASCSDHLDRLENAKQIPSDRPLNPYFFDTLCRLPDGGRYSCAQPPEVGR